MRLGVLRVCVRGGGRRWFETGAESVKGRIDMNRCGLFLILCSTALAAPNEPMTERKASQAFETAYAARDWDKAIKACQTWSRINSRSHFAAYNLACVYALDGQSEKADEALTKAISLGFSNRGHLERDPDLKSIRKGAAFRKAMADLKVKEQSLIEKAKATDPLIVLPPEHKAGKYSPVILALHGFSQTPEKIVEIWKEAAGEAGAILVAPRGVAATPRGGFEWRSVDAADAVVRHVLEFVGKKHLIDEKKVVLTGFSQGGYMAFNLGIRRGKTFCGVIPVAGSFLPDVAGEPVMFPPKLGKFYLITGENDDAKPSNELAKSTLVSFGAAVQLKVYPGLGHAFPENRAVELGKALRFVLAD